MPLGVFGLRSKTKTTLAGARVVGGVSVLVSVSQTQNRVYGEGEDDAAGLGLDAAAFAYCLHYFGFGLVVGNDDNL